MSVQLLLLLEACAVAAQTAKIVKFTPEQMQRTGAACMDGSPPAYYYADGNVCVDLENPHKRP